jgi:hypothetical protein
VWAFQNSMEVGKKSKKKDREKELRADGLKKGGGVNVSEIILFYFWRDCSSILLC